MTGASNKKWTFLAASGLFVGMTALQVVAQPQRPPRDGPDAPPVATDQRPPVGRRHHRPGRHPHGAGAGHLRRHECAGGEDTIRHLQDVGGARLFRNLGVSLRGCLCDVALFMPCWYYVSAHPLDSLDLAINPRFNNLKQTIIWSKLYPEV